MQTNKVSQLTLDILDVVTQYTLRTAPYGVPLSVGTSLLMRVKPIQFMLNSTLLTDVINRGDVLMVDINSGNLKVVKGSLVYKEVDYQFNWKPR